MAIPRKIPYSSKSYTFLYKPFLYLSICFFGGMFYVFLYHKCYNLNTRTVSNWGCEVERSWHRILSLETFFLDSDFYEEEKIETSIEKDWPKLGFFKYAFFLYGFWLPTQRNVLHGHHL